MQTSIAAQFKNTPAGEEANRILRACVHCGFCNATCPTYQLLGNELDGPRGRIYLIKQVFEGKRPTVKTLTHLDRCLTCRACETTCPSGVEYGKLAELGRAAVEKTVRRPWYRRVLRAGLRAVLPYPARVRAAVRVAQWLRPLLPRALAEQVPAPNRIRAVPGPTGPAFAAPDSDTEPETGIKGGTPIGCAVMLDGCVQPVFAPEIDQAAARVLAAQGTALRSTPAAGCCGAISYHLGAHEEGVSFMKRNIDAWLPLLDDGVDAVVSSASGCTAMVKDYGYILRNDARYAEPAARISAAVKDLSEVIEPKWVGAAIQHQGPPVAYHPPCSLQHGQQLPGRVEQLLTVAGVDLTPFVDQHLCCGSAGTYSILQSDLSEQLLDRKLDAINAGAPAEILTANIGCVMHMRRRAEVPVRHWIEVLDEGLCPLTVRRAAVAHAESPITSRR